MIVLVGCGKRKRSCTIAARHQYTGQLFRSHLELAHAFPARRILIISAMYGVIELDALISSYDLTIADMASAERDAWERGIARDVEKIAAEDELVILLAGDSYAGWLKHCARRVRTPLAGCTLGERRSIIKAFCKGPRAAHDFDEDGEDEISYHELQDEIPDQLKVGGVAAPRRTTADEQHIERSRASRPDPRSRPGGPK